MLNIEAFFYIVTTFTVLGMLFFSGCVPTCVYPVDCCLPGSSVHGISQARKLEWVAISFSRYLPDPGIKMESLLSPASAGRQAGSLPLVPPWKP